MTTPLFTCRLAVNGIGDQITQFFLLYAIGHECGFSFVHVNQLRPVSRWAPGFDLYDFFAVAPGSDRLDDLSGYDLIELDAQQAAEALLRGESPTTLLGPGVQNRTLVVLHLSRKTDAIRAFYKRSPFLWRKLFSIPARATRRRDPTTGNQVTMCVHVRRGDCAWVEHAGTYYAWRCGKKFAFGTPDYDFFIGERAVPIEKYTDLLDGIFSRFPNISFETHIYSDGYAPPDNPLSFERSVQKKILQRMSEFELFNNYPGTRVHIGTSKELTEECILDFAAADIAIAVRPYSFPVLDQIVGTPRRLVLAVKEDREQNLEHLARYLHERSP
jgi:hypothetical protein